ncbi:hypothetical protein FPK15_contig00147-0001 [Flavobacterium psychrophilum]|nr:hypothetical protein FPSM_00516 [Flavobacterium psychrophilum]GAQ50197.1 hypothetical protein FPK15_contig00147-0001 [Flavobacterium psychrophilum]GAW90838.1 hypothetical protein FPS14_contig00163-0001 [Flavobacterium psychrophilum]
MSVFFLPYIARVKSSGNFWGNLNRKFTNTNLSLKILEY